jgi:hypothetical protein
MHRLYEGRCAWLAMYVHPGTGSPTVDHFIPKSVDWSKVYEWSNYRLAALRLNGSKSDRGVVDPFVVQDDWFELEFVSFQVKPGPGAPQTREMEATCDILNQSAFCREREEYFLQYRNEGTPLETLKKQAPFLFRELQRQGRLLPHHR